MASNPVLKRTALVVSVAFVVGAAVIGGSLAARAADAPKACCFANDRYEGTCTVVPGQGETCESILAYLNNPMSTGKSYCGSTTVRGGWVQVSCNKGKAAGGAASAAPATSPTQKQPGGAVR